MDIEANLERLGLSRQEAKIYLANLKIGTSKASEIAQKAGMKREASYYTLKLLEEKGFVSEVIKSGVKYYSAIPPERIIEVIEEEKQKKLSYVEDIIPELQSLKKISITRPKIEMFEGFEGLKTAASRILDCKNQEIYCYVDERVLKFIPYFHPQFRRRRRENNVRLKVITRKNEFTLNDLKAGDKDELRETRFNDKIINDLDSSYYIMPKAILVLKANEKEQLAIYIEEPNSARLQRRIFEDMWRLAKK